LADRVRHAGAIFLGRHTPEAIGDYVAGSKSRAAYQPRRAILVRLSLYDFISGPRS